MLTHINHRDSCLNIQAMSYLGCMLDVSLTTMCILSHPCPHQCVCRYTRGGLSVPRTLFGGSSVLLQNIIIIIHIDLHTYKYLWYNFLPRTLLVSWDSPRNLLDPPAWTTVVVLSILTWLRSFQCLNWHRLAVTFFRSWPHSDVLHSRSCVCTSY